MRQTDALPSVEVVALWQCLPDEGHPLPGRINTSLQQTMRDAWRTQCGSLVAAILSAPWCVSLFKGVGADQEAPAHARGKALADAENGTAGEATYAKAGFMESERIAAVKRQFELGELRHSGLAGAFRTAAQSDARKRYVEVVQDVFDFVYLLGEVLVQFHRVSDGLGDYGMIRVAPWLHPFLETLVDKVQRIRGNLERLNGAVEDVYVLGRARGARVERPAPSNQMIARAHACIERAVTGRSSHVLALLQTFEELRARSSPERLPHVMEGLGDACMALRTVLASPEFRAHVGDAFPNLPPLGNSPSDVVVNGGGYAIEDHKVPALMPSTPSTSGSYTPPRLEVVTGAGDNLNEAASVGPDARFAGVARPTAPDVVPRVPVRRGELSADVHRMVSGGCGAGLTRHDQRSLLISDGNLYIFEKGSRSKVKSVVEIASGIEFCRLTPAGMLSLIVHRLPRGASPEDGVLECKHYTFEFPDVQVAMAFQDELTQDQPSRL
uniref:Uncharacterized protein n=1 Tax=Alexandrium catenella TaxID=2925 RepID=A0A7S1Q6U4_ALECA